MSRSLCLVLFLCLEFTPRTHSSATSSDHSSDDFSLLPPRKPSHRIRSLPREKSSPNPLTSPRVMGNATPPGFFQDKHRDHSDHVTTRDRSLSAPSKPEDLLRSSNSGMCESSADSSVASTLSSLDELPTNEFEQSSQVSPRAASESPQGHAGTRFSYLRKSSTSLTEVTTDGGGSDTDYEHDSFEDYHSDDDPHSSPDGHHKLQKRFFDDR